MEVEYFLEILAIELRDQLGETLIISFDSDRVQDGLDIFLRRRAFTTEGKEEVCREILHVDS